MKLGRKQYARDFSELTGQDRLRLVAAMVRIGRAASEKERATNLRAGRLALSPEGQK
jgi:hypothetical protein